MKSEAAISALSALAQESRLTLFRILVKRGPEGYTPGHLGSKLRIPAPTLSFHLKELQRAGLVAARREGRFLYYSASYDTMQELIGFLTEKCCSLADGATGGGCIPLATRGRRRRGA